MKRFVFALAILFSQSAFAHEQGDSYVGAQLGLITLEVDDVDNIEIPYGIFRFGIFANSSLALELRYGIDFDEDSVSGVDYAVDRIAGVYATYHFDLSEESSIYALLGYSEIDLKSKSGGNSDEEDLTSTSYGLGLDFGNINAELMQYIDRDDDMGTAVSLGYTFHFN